MTDLPTRRTTDCAFCAIISGDAPATIVAEWADAIAIAPLNPVTPGHLLVIPRRHVTDAADDPDVTAEVMLHAAYLARDPDAANIITSIGADATQTVFHLHIHVVPRQSGDGLPLPWTGQTGRTTDHASKLDSSHAGEHAARDRIAAAMHDRDCGCLDGVDDWYYSLADAVVAALPELTTTCTALCADVERERDELAAELAEIKRVTEPPTKKEMPTDPAELKELWEFINQQGRWQWHMAHKFGNQVERLRVELEKTRTDREEEARAARSLRTALDQARDERDDVLAGLERIAVALESFSEDYRTEDGVAADAERFVRHMSNYTADVRRILAAKNEALAQAEAERDQLSADLNDFMRRNTELIDERDTAQAAITRVRDAWSEWRGRIGGSLPPAMLQEMDAAALRSPEATDGR